MTRFSPIVLSALSVLILAAAGASAAPASHGPASRDPANAAGPTGAPSGGGCAPDDVYEPDSFASPQPLSPGQLDGLAVCAGNDDYWRIEVQPGMLLRLRAEFSHALGDIDLTLHRADNTQIDISDGVTDSEELVFQATRAETLILRVYGYNGATNQYRLSVQVDDFSRSCPGDLTEPNNGPMEATVAADSGEARICLEDEDWFAVDVGPGEGFDFGVDFDRRLGNLSLAIYDARDTSRAQRVVRARDGSAVAMLDGSERAGRYLVRVWAPDGGFNRYTYSVARYAPGVGFSGIVAGRVQYEDYVRGEDVVIGAPWNRWLPARQVPVELVRSIDNRVIATSYTSETGDYSLSFNHRAGGPAFIRVAARLEAPSYQMRILQHEETRLPQVAQSVALDSLERYPSGTYRADFTLRADALGGAFNITDRMLDAFRFIERHRPADNLDLTVIWQRGRPHACTSCFDDDTIYLGGGFEDPDEYDDSVILHEFGHFFVHTMSHDDSPGGNHNGDRTDPLVAYGEGIATVFAMMVEGSPIYTDTMTTGGLLQDFERAPFNEVFGTLSGTVTGQISEYLVVALIWDLMDDGEEPHDSLRAGEDAIMRILLDYMPTCQTRNQGIAGADLADFVAGFRALFPRWSAQLDTMMAHYQFPGGRLRPM